MIRALIILSVLILTVSFLTGCDIGLPYYRTNHFHSAANHEAMKSVHTAITGFANDKAGLETVLRQNLEARLDLARLVGGKGNGVADKGDVFDVSAMKWDELNERYCEAFRLTGKDRFEINARMEKRIQLLLAVYNVLAGVAEMENALAAKASEELANVKKIVEGQRALEDAKKTIETLRPKVATLEAATKAASAALEAAKKVVPPDDTLITELTTKHTEATAAEAEVKEALSAAEKASADAAKNVPALITALEKTHTESKSLVEQVLEMRRILATASEAKKFIEAIRNKADQLQMELLDAAKGSRDPASAYALVAAVDTGLADDDLDVLREYCDWLISQADRIAAIGGSEATTTALLDQGKPVPVANLRLNAAVNLVQRRVTSPATKSPGTSFTDLFKNKTVEAKELGPAFQRLSAGVLLANLARNQITDETDKKDAIAAIGIPPNTPQAAPPSAPPLTSDARSGTLEGLLETLKKLSEKYKSISEENASAMTDLLADDDVVGMIAKALVTTKGEANLNELGTSFLKSVLAGNPELAAGVGKRVNSIVTPAQLQAIGQIVSDIAAEQRSRHLRVNEYVRDLYQITVELRKENARHAQMMQTIADAELRRWRTLVLLDLELTSIFDATKRNDAIDKKTPEDRLVDLKKILGDVGEVKHFKLIEANKSIFHSMNKSPSAVKGTDYIVQTIRKFAYKAQTLQAEDTSNDGDSNELIDQTRNLRLSIHAVNGHLVVLSLNRKLASDNGVVLMQEIAEHDLHIDRLHANIREARIYYLADDQAAFHASGLNDSDFALVADIALGIIAGRVD